MRALIIALALSGCTATQLADVQARHRAFVCSHQSAVAIAGDLAIENAPKIKDANVRAAAIAVARNDLDILATCE